MRIVDRSGHRNDHEISLFKRCGIGTDLEQGGCLQVIRAHLVGWIKMLLVAGDFFRGKIDANGAEFLAKFHGQG